MQDLDTQDLANVSGGAGVLENMSTGAVNLSHRWDNATANAIGRRTFPGKLGGAVAGLAGVFVGGLQGLGHSVTDKIPLPQP